MLGRGTKEHDALHTGPGRLLLAVAVGVLTVLACNWGARHFLDRYGTNLGYVYIAHKWSVLERLDAPVDWLVLGDSSVSQSFDPAVVKELAGKRAINLGTIGNYGVSGDLWMLEEYLERFGAPERVIIVHAYDVWHRRFNANLIGRIPRDWVLSDEIATRYELDEETREEIFLNRYVPLHAERTSLRKGLEYAWQRLTKNDEELAELRKQDRSLPVEDPVLHDDGFVSMCGAVPDAVKRDARSHVKNLGKRRFSLSKDNRAALLRIAELAHEHGFRVHVVNGPIYERLRLKPEFQRYYDDAVEHLRRALADYPEVEVLDGVRGYDGDRLQNVDHVTCDAADDYTRWVMQRIGVLPENDQ